MHKLKLILSAAIVAGLGLLQPAPGQAADVNGYTAEYECRAGGARCNVDVAALGARACDQIIDPATPWSSINWSNNTICLAAGDHTGKGTLTIPPSANGTASNYKVLRYHRAQDNDDEPWRQSGANQARLQRLVVQGDFWLIHRLTFPNVGDVAARIEYFATASNDVRDIIINRVLVEGAGAGTNFYGISTNGDDSQDYQGLAVQNSVLRNVGPVQPLWEAIAISLHVGPPDRDSRFYIVNNEIYDWVSHPIQIGRNELPTIPGIVVENNDLYVTQALYTPDGRAKTESVLSTKVAGTSAHPIRVLNNRMWGTRPTNMDFCCNGDGGQAIGQYTPNAFTLHRDNIVFDSQVGFDNMANDNSLIGNLFYNIAHYYPPYASYAWRTWWHPDHGIGDRYEAYLNTVVRATGNSVNLNGGSAIDTRCNVFIDSGGATMEPTGGGEQADYNVFYATPKFTRNATDTNLELALRDRAGATPYNVGEVLRTANAESCGSGGGSACFLYRVTQAGTSASTAPAYCTSLGCTTTDGTLTVQAIRGPHCFFNKLRTTPQRMCIPYATVHASAPEQGFCPTALGTRAGIGINNDTAWSGILAKDLTGASRSGTPGAFEAGTAGGGGNGVTYVSDLPYTVVANGYGPVEKDRSNGEDAAGDGRVLTLNGVTYAKGLGVHAVSEVRVPLNGNYMRFVSDIGIDDEMDGTAGTAQFEVWADGVRLYQSPDMNAASPTLSVNLDVTGKQELRLIVTEGSVSCCDHADWAGARLLAHITYISDLPYTAVSNSWGPVEKDRSNGEDAAGDGRVITLNGVTYAKGLGVHAVSEVRVPLGGNYSRFISDIGIDDEMDGTAGTAQFEVWADGVRLYQSPDMNAASPTLSVNVDVTGKQELRLIVTEGSVSCCDHADWAGARLLSNTVFVSDLPYVALANGYGPVEKDRSNGEDMGGDGNTLTLNGVTYAKGLGVHAVSEVRVFLGGNYSRFISDIGIDDEMDGTAGTAQFEVWADGVRLYQSADMNATSPTITVNLDVTGRQELRLLVTEGSVGCCDHADWAGARLTQ